MSEQNEAIQITNLSKQNRDEMLSFLKELSGATTDTKQLLMINRIMASLQEKPYGLVWEHHTENVDKMLADNIPVFTEDDDRRIALGGESPYHFLLEGDNLHSLMLLEKAHVLADIIYIDPPYNTLKKDFKYDDTMVDENDRYPHSKWLSFMERRLRIAYKLLKKDGIIFISIGDDEIAQLKLLCDEIFGESNKLGLCPRIAKKGSNKGTYFRPTKDYILCYAKSKKDVSPFYLIKDNDASKYKFTESTGPNAGKKYKKGHSLYQASLDARPNQRYYIEAPDGTLIIPPGNTFPVDKKDGAFVVPESNDDKCYRWSYESYLKHKAEGIIMFAKSKKSPFIDSDGNPTKWNVYEKKYYDPDAELTTLPDDVVYDFLNSQGQTELSKMGIDFSFSKPVELIKYLISITNKPNDIVVLDFFAGSGTTGQAVLELNHNDQGTRKVILCTNNEVDDDLAKKLIQQGISKESNEWQLHGICQSITYPRLRTTITGKKVNGDEYVNKKGKITYRGIPANLKYFRTDFVKRYKEATPDELAEHSAEMVELEKGIHVESFKCFDAKYILLKNDDEADFVYDNFDQYCNLQTIYIIEDTNESDSVILSNAQLEKFKDMEIIAVPRWYFESEIREVG